MDVRNVEGESYSVTYEPETTTIYFCGSLRLSGMKEYMPIVELMNAAADGAMESRIILNLRELEFLNSSGIGMLSKFAIGMRKRETIEILVKGDRAIAWQGKSLKNLQRLMPKLVLEFE
ncbi:MAG: hypothetical protein AAFY11_03665 [Cyanobacteria bacterium J06641_5]